MGFLFNDLGECREKIRENFSKTDSYLFAIKHNSKAKGLLKLLVSDLYNTLDSSRTFLLNFNEKGIYEKEISNSTKGDFILMPWDEINSFEIDERSNKAFINFSHLGKNISYEISFNGKMCEDNLDNFKNLKENNWHRL
ncbi:MAG: histidine kinase [Anaerococcus sp.]|nr:histidine kinase [Anaerococcus sp.]